MPKARIPPRLRDKVGQTAKCRCGYCLTPQLITGMRMQIDHIVPEAMGGATVEALRMNNADIVGARSLWVQAGWWPPED
jgi:hypothetical protein